MISLTILTLLTIAGPIQNLNKRPLKDFSHLKRLQLAHPVTYTEQFIINVLIEAHHYWDVVKDNIIKGNGSTAVGLKLGYLLSGSVDTAIPRNKTDSFCT